MAAVAGCAWELLPTSLEAFSQDRPDVEIEIVEESPADVIERVKSRRADVGLVYSASARNVERLNSSDLEIAMVRREPVVAVVPHDHPVLEPQVDLAAMAGSAGRPPSVMPVGRSSPTSPRRPWSGPASLRRPAAP